jgi:hypothetical protein
MYVGVVSEPTNQSGRIVFKYLARHSPATWEALLEEVRGA